MRPVDDLTLRALREAIEAQRGEELDSLLEELDLQTLPVALLNELLVMPGHQQHQQVAFALQWLGDPSTLPYAARALAMGFDHLQYTASENDVIAKWFSWLLAGIEAPGADALLQQYACSDDPDIAAEMRYRISKLDEVRAWISARRRVRP